MQLFFLPVKRCTLNVCAKQLLVSSYLPSRLFFWSFFLFVLFFCRWFGFALRLLLRGSVGFVHYQQTASQLVHLVTEKLDDVQHYILMWAKLIFRGRSSSLLIKIIFSVNKKLVGKKSADTGQNTILYCR